MAGLPFPSDFPYIFTGFALHSDLSRLSPSPLLGNQIDPSSSFTMRSFALSFLVLFLFHSSLQPSTAQEDDVPCLQGVKSSITDPSGSLSSWVFGNTSAGHICSFFGVECAEPGQNTVLAIKLPAANLSGELPVNGLSQCSSLQVLDLSNNFFDGGIPTNTCILLPTLTSLNLSWNKFTGGLSDNISSCPHLQSLTLQHNELSGILPWEIGILPNLTVFDVSYNNFTGQIPTTYASRTMVSRQPFPVSSYEGNEGLCGEPLNKSCVGM